MEINSRLDVEAKSDVVRWDWQRWFEYLKRKMESDWVFAGINWDVI